MSGIATSSAQSPLPGPNLKERSVPEGKKGTL